MWCGVRAAEERDKGVVKVCRGVGRTIPFDLVYRNNGNVGRGRWFAWVKNLVDGAEDASGCVLNGNGGARIGIDRSDG